MMSNNNSQTLQLLQAGAPLSSATAELPAELALACLAYCDFGSLARLASTQSAWQSLLYTSAADTNATWELAQALLNGTHGLARNPVKAMELFRTLANVELTADHEPIVVNKGECFAPAMKKMATCYLTGDGVDVNRELGLAWFQTTHQLGGDLDAAHELALVYEYGQYGVEIDVVVAAQWFTKAAEAGHLEAMAELALCYELGCGVEQSDETALEWYMKAAEGGHITAKFSVGEAFEEARGVPQSDEEACLWYYKAATDGCADSKKALQRLADIARIVVPGVRGLLDV